MAVLRLPLGRVFAPTPVAVPLHDLRLSEPYAAPELAALLCSVDNHCQSQARSAVGVLMIVDG